MSTAVTNGVTWSDGFKLTSAASYEVVSPALGGCSPSAPQGGFSMSSGAILSITAVDSGDSIACATWTETVKLQGLKLKFNNMSTFNTGTIATVTLTVNP